MRNEMSKQSLNMLEDSRLYKPNKYTRFLILFFRANPNVEHKNRLCFFLSKTLEDI